MVSVSFRNMYIYLLDEQTHSLKQISTTCNVAAGLIGAGLMGLVFFKGGRARAAMSGFGAGVGAGLSWEEVHKNLGNLFERN
tara:strand:+ start:139 stop:384 length:246 start_codon:yes stop_codon:yes gene_type:complete